MGDERVLQGRYRLGEKLGEGGMGIVYRGTDLRLERPVAVKLVHPTVEGSEARLERFLREAKLTAQLRHPGIVDVYDFGQTDDGEAFFVMELLLGEPLSARLRREKNLGCPAAVHIALQICDAVAAAHAAGLVHRDLKPANIILVRAGDDDARVKVVDFGVAKKLGGATKLTESGMLVGTIDYMAPEQIRGEDLDGRADVYALGAMLTIMLTGLPVFETDNVAALVHRHLSVTPAPVRERDPSLSPAIEAVVRKCLMKDPAARFQTMQELSLALVAALEGRAPAASSRVVLPARLPAGEREIELDDLGDAAGSPHLELEEVEHRPARPVPAPLVAPSVPGEARPLAPAPVHQATPPAPWVARLAVLPIGVSKRIVGYALVALVILHVFFRPGALTTAAVVAVAFVGGLLLWARHRVESGPRW